MINSRSTISKFWPLVPCAGTGKRSGAHQPKQYVELAGQPVIEYTLNALQALPMLESVTVVLAPEDVLFTRYCPCFTGHAVYVGGQTRASSVRFGLQQLRLIGAKDHDWVLVHDAARCLLKPEWVQSLIDECCLDEVGGLLAQPVPDTLKRSCDGRVLETLSRENMWIAQTPQMFRLALLEKALHQAYELGLDVTDESSSIEALGLEPKLVMCSAENFKLTYPDDFRRAESILILRQSK